MNNMNPIYTEKAECQDCYKCVRECPVKAIKIQNGAAAIIPELCVLCGHCVNVCPAKAKRVRNDTEKVYSLLKTKEIVIASLAPSYVSEFGIQNPARIIAALKKIGFYGVSETALGAQQVSAHITQQLSCQDKKIFISSACPVMVDLITHYIPRLTSSVTGLLSPMLSHSKLIRKRYGDVTGVVFFGPCIAKKREADNHPHMIDAVLTFEDLSDWLRKEKIDLSSIEYDETDVFIPTVAEEGALYPVDGGMLATIKSNCTTHDSSLMSISGLKNVWNALEEIDTLDLKESLFIEALSCEGGCINGPLSSNPRSTIKNRLSIVKSAKYPIKKIPRTPALSIAEFVADNSIEKKLYTEAEISAALIQVGKLTIKDELNCGGCGYDTCHDFAAALLSGKAETTMCVTYMRKLSQNKASGLIRTMPSGVVIVNQQLKIIESNINFARLFGLQTGIAFDSSYGLEGVSLKKLVPVYDLFKQVLDLGNDIIQQEININKRIIQGSIFSIEPHMVIGGVFADVTAPSINKVQFISQAQKVIQKNRNIVQKIAQLLGENASETETVLNSIIESFSNQMEKSNENSICE